MHEHQIKVSTETVSALIRDQFPEWKDMEIRHRPSSGTVNEIFTIGLQYAARFPLLGDELGEVREILISEARASAEFSKISPFPSPTPVALGEPGHGYPLPWSVQTWVRGVDASQNDPADNSAFARDLVSLIRALRSADTGGRTFSGENRGGDLSQHDRWVQECLDNSRDFLDVRHLSAIWRQFRLLPRTTPDVMTHGDLIPANILVTEAGRLAGVLDCGGFAAADPALDVIAGWHLLDDGPRAVFRAKLGVDDLEWERSKAWAFEQAIGAVWYYADTNATMSQMGRKTLERIVSNTNLTV